MVDHAPPDRRRPRILKLEHIGSTAVSGLAAKPVIDLMAAVPTLADTARTNRPSPASPSTRTTTA